MNKTSKGKDGRKETKKDRIINNIRIALKECNFTEHRANFVANVIYGMLKMDNCL